MDSDSKVLRNWEYLATSVLEIFYFFFVMVVDVWFYKIENEFTTPIGFDNKIRWYGRSMKNRNHKIQWPRTFDKPD